MAKKVAQLTKVIYLLNTKNDEHMYEMSALEAQYEYDVEMVLRDAEDRVNQLKERLENKASAEISALGGNAVRALEEARRGHEADRKAAQAKLDKLREQSLANETILRNAGKDKLDQLRKEVEDAKQQFLLRMHAFSRVTKAMEAQHATALLEQKNKSLKEMEEYVKVSNAKYNSMLNERMTMEEELKGKLKSAMKNADNSAELDKALAKAQSENAKLVASTKASFEGQITKLNNELEMATRRIMEAKENAKAEIAAAEKAAAEKAAAIAAKKSADEAARNAAESARALSAMSETLEKFRSENESLKRQLTDAEKKNISLQNQLDTLAAQSRMGADAQAKASLEERTNLQSMLSSLQDELSAIQGKEAILQKEKAALAAALKKSDETVSRLRNELSAVENSLESTKQQSASLSADIASREREAELLRKSKESGLQGAATELAQLRSEYNKLEHECNKYRSLNDSINAQLNSIQEEQIHIVNERRELEIINRTQREEIEQLQKQLTDAVSQLQQQTLASESTESDLRRQLGEYEARIHSLTGEQGAAMEQLQLKYQQLQADYAAQSENLSTARTLSAQLQHQLDTLNSKIAELQSRIQQLELALEEERTRASQDSGAQTKALSRLQSELVSTQNERAALESIRVKLDESLLKLGKSLEETRAEGKAKEEYLRAQLDAQIKAAAQERALASSANAGEMDRMRASIEALKEESSALLNQSLIDHQAELDTLRKQHALDMESLRVELNESFQNREKSLRQSLDELRQSTTVSLMDATNKHRQAMADAIKKYETEQAEMTSAHTHAIQSLKASSDMRLNSLKERLESDIASVKELAAKSARQAEMDAAARESLLHRERDELASKLESQTIRANGLDESLKGLINELDQTRMHASRKQSQLEKDHADALDDQSQKHRDELARVLRQHADEIAQLQLVHSNAIGNADTAYAELQRTLAALQYRFDHREPRIEDVNRIRELEAYALASEKAKRQAIEELKYYKLELLNREENFNKTFGRSPAVAPQGQGQISSAPNNTGSGVTMAGKNVSSVSTAASTGSIQPGGVSVRTTGLSSTRALTSTHAASPHAGSTSAIPVGVNALSSSMTLPQQRNSIPKGLEEEKSAGAASATAAGSGTVGPNRPRRTQ
jgi:chromosome segregation ATPase